MLNNGQNIPLRDDLDKMTRQEIAEFQLQLLCNIVRTAREKSEHYRPLFGDRPFQGFSDLKSIPVNVEV